MRTRTGIATQTDQGQERSPSPSQSRILSDLGPHAVGTDPDTEVIITSRTYSDVVASRVPSPVKERPATPSESPENNDEDETYRLDKPDYVSTGTNRHVMVEHTLGDVQVSGTPESQEWTTVTRKPKHARSHSLPKGGQRALTAEQAKVVKVAAEGMTEEQRQKLSRRTERIHHKHGSEVSRGEGPSNRKGKTIDPREWGNVSQDGLDIEAQAAALESFKANTKRPRTYKGRTSRDAKKGELPGRDQTRRSIRSEEPVKRAKHTGRPDEFQPAAQIAPRSYLGRALRNIQRSRDSGHSPSSSPSSSNLSPNSPSSEDST